MSAFQKLFKQTFIYGLATVLPRMLTFLLVPLYTTRGVLDSVADYGKVSIVFSWVIIFNVILAYGMETAFFRFFNKEKDQDQVIGTSTISLIVTSLVFFFAAFYFKEQIANTIGVEIEYIKIVLWILLLDALVIIPFAWLRAKEKPMKYALIKITNVVINMGLNLFFLLWLKNLAQGSKIFDSIYIPHFQINYIFISILIASAVTLLLMTPFYTKVKFKFSSSLWKQMLRYAFPVLIAGLAFSVNESFNRIMMDYLLPEDIAEEKIGMFAACYKLALFMTLFATAYRLGIEPYFFSHSNSKEPQKNYAKILEYFVIFGSVILLTVVVFADLLKPIIIRSDEYWEAMWIVPLVLLAHFCLGIYHNLSVWYKITDRTKFGAYISVIGAIITLILNFWLIPIMDYRGSAIALLAAYGTMMLLSYFFGKKYYPIPYNLKKIGIYLLLSIVFSVISFYYFRENYLVGIPLLFLFIAVTYALEKKELKHLINN
ncbi:MAG: oligosaccharide flippase family protein [Flavobacteriaceae bacterium]|nr:oligosaccharide flippase family protein [Flavobacteriaceae bacterium]